MPSVAPRRVRGQRDAPAHKSSARTLPPNHPAADDWPQTGRGNSGRVSCACHHPSLTGSTRKVRQSAIKDESVFCRKMHREYLIQGNQNRCKYICVGQRVTSRGSCTNRCDVVPIATRLSAPKCRSAKLVTVPSLALT